MPEPSTGWLAALGLLAAARMIRQPRSGAGAPAARWAASDAAQP
ncbi:MAG: PEP-CTERM sorting domain-containing protein [Thiobacillus sp.]